MTDSRDRDGRKQRFTRVRPVAFDGSKPLAHREGGKYPLPVRETSPGVYLSGWYLEREDIMALLNDPKCDTMLSLIIDTNVPGHPAVSMQVQEVFITNGDDSK